MTVVDELSRIEVAKLENLESVIEGGLKSFLDVGRALMEIRDGRLYRATHMNFESYCRDRWDMSRNYADVLVSGVQIVDKLPTNVVKPTCEAHVRPLAKLPEDDQAAAWKEAVETAPEGRITAAHVEQIVKTRLPESPAKEDDAHKSNGTAGNAPGRTLEKSKEAEEIVAEFSARLGVVSDGAVYTLETLRKAFKANGNHAALLFVRQCEVSPAVKVHRNYGKRGVVQYSFELTNCVTGHARIRQLAQQIASDPASTSRIKSAAEAILTLLGG